MFGIKRRVKRLEASSHVAKIKSGYIDKLTGLMYNKKGRLNEFSVPDYTEENDKRHEQVALEYLNKSSSGGTNLVGFLPQVDLPVSYTGDKDSILSALAIDAVTRDFSAQFDDNYEYIWAFDFDKMETKCVILAGTIEEAINIYVERYGIRSVSDIIPPLIGNTQQAVDNYNKIAKSNNVKATMSSRNVEKGILYQYVVE